MFRILGLALLVTAPVVAQAATKYEDHKSCLEAQSAIYELQATIQAWSRTFGSGYRKSDVGSGNPVARETDDAFKALDAASRALATRHALYCREFPLK